MPRAPRPAPAALLLVLACEAGGSTSASESSTDAASTSAASSTGGDATASATQDATSTAAASSTGESTSLATTAASSTTDVSTTDTSTTDTSTTDASTTDTSTGGGGLALPWAWIAALDQGIRDDDYGLGHFRAPRSGYEHSGIDFLMPVGTALTSPCDGAYLADYDGGYGNWVQVICPVPSTITGGATVFASLLFAHLETTALPTTGIDPNAAGAVKAGQLLGESGKSGNASAAGIHAHLHFEVALHGSELDGLLEAHKSGADEDTPAAAALRAGITAACLEPTGFAPTQSTLHLGRRVDPFILLTCLSADKPPLQAPQIQPLHAWSDDYTAATFDVDAGI